MLALVVVVELFVAARRLDFTTIWADDWRSTAEAATRRTKARDVLIFGDSLAKFAVLPRQIEATTGLRSYNLALNAGTMPSAYFLLRRTLEAGAKPRAIVADFCTLMQPDRPSKSVRLYPELATTLEVGELAWISGDADFLASALLGKLLPSYKCRYEIRESVKAAFDGRRASPWPSQSAVWTTWKHQEGAQPMPSNGQGAAPNPGMALDLSPRGWECDPTNAAYVEKFLELAGSRQIPVFWLIPPLTPEVHAVRASQGSDEAYTRFVEATLTRHPDVVVLDARQSRYDRSLYIDPIHLGRSGAKVLSTDLGRLLAERMGSKAEAGRWVNLPHFDGRKGEVATGGMGRRQ
jgi:hypothetical protein